jgi:hypothetical protein
VKGSRNVVSAALFLWAAVILFLIGGCAQQTQNSAAATTSAITAPSGSLEDIASPKPIQSSSEADMVRFFHFLLEMDSGSKTTLSQKQAEAVLPVVRRNVEKGTMEEADRLAILNVFRAEQKSFYSRWVEQERKSESREGQEGFSPHGLTEAERQQWRDDWLSRDDGFPGPRPGYEPDSGASRPEHPEPGPEDWAAGEKNVEQQLIELLERKTD